MMLEQHELMLYAGFVTMGGLAVMLCTCREHSVCTYVVKYTVYVWGHDPSSYLPCITMAISVMGCTNLGEGVQGYRLP